MGRLFWKFFGFIWGLQLIAIAVTATIFWLEHQQWESKVEQTTVVAPAELPPEPKLTPPHHRRGPPVLPIVATLIASLVCAALLARYFSRPIRTLRNAFDAAAAGKLDTRIGATMGGRRDELADLGRDFDRMAGQLQDLMDGQKRLLHDVSHELRSPLARLQVAIGLLRQQPARLTDSLDRIEREGERMDTLVGELLTLSRLEAGVTGSSEDVDMAELLTVLVEDASFEAEAAGRRVLLARATDTLVRGNGELLHRAIENIVRNAIRHTAQGTTVDVDCTLDRAHHRLYLTVADRGPGIPEAELQSIFQPFFRGSGGAGSDGHGLGLAIARQVAEASGGSITAANRPGGGLVVTLALPVVA